MNHRLLDVTAYTTLDFVEGRATGPDWSDETPAVIDVTTPENEPETVRLDVEFDPGGLEHVEPHADQLFLSPEQARSLADDLQDVARRAERTGAEPGADDGKGAR